MVYHRIFFSVETDKDDNTSSALDLGPQNEEDIAYNEETEMSSLFLIPRCQLQEIEAAQQQLSLSHSNEHTWPGQQ